MCKNSALFNGAQYVAAGLNCDLMQGILHAIAQNSPNTGQYQPNMVNWDQPDMCTKVLSVKHFDTSVDPPPSSPKRLVALDHVCAILLSIVRPRAGWALDDKDNLFALQPQGLVGQQ